MSKFFTDLDGAGEPTIFEATAGDPAVVVRRAELPGPRSDLLWRVLTGVLCGDEETRMRVAWAVHNVECGCTDPDHLSAMPPRGYTDISDAVLAALGEARSHATDD